MDELEQEREKVREELAQRQIELEDLRREEARLDEQLKRLQEKQVDLERRLQEIQRTIDGGLMLPARLTCRPSEA